MLEEPASTAGALGETISGDDEELGTTTVDVADEEEGEGEDEEEVEAELAPSLSDSCAVFSATPDSSAPTASPPKAGVA